MPIAIYPEIIHVIVVATIVADLRRRAWEWLTRRTAPAVDEPPAPTLAPAKDAPAEAPAAPSPVAASPTATTAATAAMFHVARRAGVTKGTLYLYFPNKEELFKAVVRQAVVANIVLGEALVAHSSEPAPVVLEQLIARLQAKTLADSTRQHHLAFG